MPAGAWIAGVSIGIFSKSVASLGLVLQKRWHARNASLPPEKRKAWYSDLWWMAGFATYAGGNLITIAALALAPQTVIAALDSLVLVFNALWAPWLLHERVGRSDWAFNFVIIGGVVLVVAYGPPMSGDHTGRELVKLLLEPTYLAFAGTSVAILGGCALYRSRAKSAALSRRASFRQPPRRPSPPGGSQRRTMRRACDSGSRHQLGTPGASPAGADAPRAVGWERSAGQLDVPQVARGMSTTGLTRSTSYLADESPRSQAVFRRGTSVAVPAPDPTAAVAAAVAPAVLSCFCLQLSKIIGELIAETVNGHNEFADWPAYVFILSLLAVNTLQVKMLQAALIDFSALVVVPIFQVSLTLFAVIGGGIYFKEFDAWGVGGDQGSLRGQLAGPLLFSFGLLLAVTGVICLSLRGSNIPERIWGACCRPPVESPGAQQASTPARSPQQSPQGQAEADQVTQVHVYGNKTVDITPVASHVHAVQPAPPVLNYSMTMVPWCELSFVGEHTPSAQHQRLFCEGELVEEEGECSDSPGPPGRGGTVV
eukprot:TRINITY_DN14571_c1_g1_i1.p1 TRINITY_DN14571_c1_g1~~TRINITY_DN14571_c1_g1_i1.p1  ORF type:complete len:551 (+),score=129.75 TRINITY_DN14571_c1_g1_i1:35-1654(+)